MDELRITLQGFGSANRALARMLLSKSVPSPPTSKSSSSQEEGRRLCLRAVGGRSGSIGDDGSGVRLVPWRIVSIVTRRHGRVCVPLRTDDTMSHHAPYWEIDLEMALHRVESGGILDRSVVTNNQYPSVETNDDIQWHVIADQLTNADETLQLISQLGQSNTSNIVVEAIPSNTKGDGEPAISFIAMALQWKMHVVSANKVPLAHTCCSDDGEGGGFEDTYWKLQQLAQCNNVTYQHESAVMDGVPLFSLWKYALPHITVTSIRGCLNSTTTMMLSRMEGSIDDEDGRFDDVGGESFHDALIAAKEMGIVEEDDSLDLDGYDAAVKLRALLVVLSSTPLTSTFNETGTATVPTMDEISRDSIRNISAEDIGNAYSNGRKKYRLVASARLLDVPTNMEQDQGAENDGCRSCCPSKRWEASVKLQLLSPSDPLYNLRGTDSAIQFSTDVMGSVTVVSSNPTLVDTAYGLYSDIVRVACA